MTDSPKKGFFADAIRRQGIDPSTVKPNDAEVNAISGQRYEDDMGDSPSPKVSKDFAQSLKSHFLPEPKPKRTLTDKIFDELSRSSSVIVHRPESMTHKDFFNILSNFYKAGYLIETASLPGIERTVISRRP